MKLWMYGTALAAMLAAGGAMAQTGSNPDFGACDTNYEAVDANGDGTVSTEEARQAAEYEFGRLDRDGNGEISLAEWRNCSGVAFLKSAFTQEEGQATKAVTDGEQAASGGTASGEQAAGEPTPGDQASGSSGAETSATGTAAEVTGSIGKGTTMDQPSNGLPTIGEYTEENFAAADADQSGDVNRAEAAAWASQSFHDREARGDEESASAQGQSSAQADDQGQPEGGLPTEEQAARAASGMFTGLDADGDGLLTRQEWSARQSDPNFNRFSVMDEDNNAILTKEEWETRATAALEEAQTAPLTVWTFWYLM